MKLESSEMISNSVLDPEKPMFPISVVSDLLKVHQRTLRIYDEAELLSPKRSQKNRRLYSFNDIERGKCIQHLTRELGVNLSGIKIIFSLLGQKGVSPNQYIDYLKEIAESLNITPEIQQENLLKSSRRGRKPSVKK